MLNTRLKICGITRPQDAVLAAEFGADLLGLNFFKGPRKIDFETAVAILNETGRHTKTVQWVALVGGEKFAAETPAEVRAMRRALDACTFFQHYDTAAQLASAFERLGNSFSKSIWLVRHVPSRESLRVIGATIASLPFTPSGVVLDTASKSGLLGGTGHSFNWRWIAEARDAGELEGFPPIILAGGLTPDNVAEAIRIARPYAVDVSSGVEAPGKPGVKDPVKMRDFIQAAKSV
ncbi:MAG TPA: phosphoribosylanthranilate isomerase [Phycisphaerae bacterium]|nr:phosphoribosylanthranilate isomerase [Phycisphaerae bacterium]